MSNTKIIKLDLKYVAGLVDGEGSIFIHKQIDRRLRHYLYYLRLAVSNTYRPILYLLKDQFGGSIKEIIFPKDKNYKTAYIWALASRSAFEFIKLIQPYLIIKKEQAKLATKFQKIKTKNYHKGKRLAFGDDILYLKMRGLNKRGSIPMGNTSIIELDHDSCYEIEKNKDLFVEQILEHLRAGYDSQQDIEGGKIIAFFPRYSDNRKYCAWERFKTKWMNKNG